MGGFVVQTLGPYRLLHLLDVGGMGQVYRAFDPRLDLEVAIKILPFDLAREPVFLARFQSEASILARLNHPNIVPIKDFGVEGPIMYLVMPLITGGTLREYLADRRVLLLREVVPLIEQVSSALQSAHDLHFIHSDVKPENLLFHSKAVGDIQLLLADFGIARAVNPASRYKTQAEGTVTYMAPEQIEATPVPASDQYSLAVMTYELLTGKVPFTGSTLEIAEQHISQAPPLLRSINPAISSEVEEVILKALEKRPEERWPSVDKYAQALRAAFNREEPHLAEKPLSRWLIKSGQRAEVNGRRGPGARLTQAGRHLTTVASRAAYEPRD